MYACMHLITYICMFYMYACQSVYSCVYEFICAGICVFVFMLCVCVCICVYVCLFMSLCVCNLLSFPIEFFHPLLVEFINKVLKSRFQFMKKGQRQRLVGTKETTFESVLQGVQEKLCFFTIHCNPSFA